MRKSLHSALFVCVENVNFPLVDYCACVTKQIRKVTAFLIRHSAFDLLHFFSTFSAMSGNADTLIAFVFERQNSKSSKTTTAVQLLHQFKQLNAQSGSRALQSSVQSLQLVATVPPSTLIAATENELQAEVIRGAVPRGLLVAPRGFELQATGECVFEHVLFATPHHLSAAIHTLQTHRHVVRIFIIAPCALFEHGR